MTQNNTTTTTMQNKKAGDCHRSRGPCIWLCLLIWLWYWALTSLWIGPKKNCPCVVVVVVLCCCLWHACLCLHWSSLLPSCLSSCSNHVCLVVLYFFAFLLLLFLVVAIVCLCFVVVHVVACGMQSLSLSSSLSLSLLPSYPS